MRGFCILFLFRQCSSVFQHSLLGDIHNHFCAMKPVTFKKIPQLLALNLGNSSSFPFDYPPSRVPVWHMSFFEFGFRINISPCSAVSSFLAHHTNASPFESTLLTMPFLSQVRGSHIFKLWLKPFPNYLGPSPVPGTYTFLLFHATFSACGRVLLRAMFLSFHVFCPRRSWV